MKTNDASATTVPSITVGMAVRAKRTQNNETFLCKGTVITLENEDDGDGACASILWDDLSPQPITLVENNGVEEGNGKKMVFIVCPHFSRNKDEEEEVVVPLSDISPLLPFEKQQQQTTTAAAATTAEQHKEYGDALFKLRDMTSAISQYEAVLSLTSTNMSIGSTVIMKHNNRPILADVDCVDDEDDTCDVTLVQEEEEEEEEMTISKKQILLSLLENDENDRIQERTLLNLSKCLLRLADLDGIANRKVKYCNGAVLGCTLAMSCSSYYNNNISSSSSNSSASTTTTEEKARYIRCKAYTALHKYKHAQQDVQYLKKQKNKDAMKLQKELENAMKYEKRVNKKLVKEVCSWVNSVTAEGDDDGSGGNENDKRKNLPSSNTPSPKHDVHHDSSYTNESFNSWYLVWIVVPLLIAVVLAKDWIK